MDMNPQVDWLAGILGARDFPLDRLVRALEIGADVIAESVGDDHGHRLSTVLTEAAAYLRAQLNGST